MLLANLVLPATRVSDLITLARSKPRGINFGSGGQGTSLHLSGELLNYLHKIEMVHVPYRGSGPAVVALISNEIQVLFDNSMTAIGHVRGGRVKALGVAAKNRLAALPDLPTVGETLAGFEKPPSKRLTYAYVGRDGFLPEEEEFADDGRFSHRKRAECTVR